MLRKTVFGKLRMTLASTLAAAANFTNSFSSSKLFWRALWLL
ncbi:MAG TPA: hypothetical protein VIK35_06880 [Verrucomicrobiae bacterium]